MENSNTDYDYEDVGEMIEIEDNDDISDMDDLHLDDDNDDMVNDEEECWDDEDYENQAIEPPREDASIIFKGHNDEVYCIANSDGIVATGGKDDKCLVWNAVDGQVLFECTGHEESVDSVAFNHNGTYLATGDLKGLVQVWDIKTRQKIWSFEISSIQWLAWHHKTNLLLSGSVDGEVWLWMVPFDQAKTLPSHGSPSTCGTFFPDGTRVCIGYEDGTVRIWDLKTATCNYVFPPSARNHESHVICVDCHHGNNLVATGSWDGTVLITNSMSGQVLARYSVLLKESNNDEDNSEDRIESLSFSSNTSIPYLAIGCSSGKVVIWDLNAMVPRFQSLGHVADIVKVLWHPTQSHLLMSCSVDGSVVAWDSRNGQQVSCYYGHTKRIFGFDIERSGERAFTASADFTARVYKI